jgi:hypothetical protein
MKGVTTTFIIALLTFFISLTSCLSSVGQERERRNLSAQRTEPVASNASIFLAVLPDDEHINMIHVGVTNFREQTFVYQVFAIHPASWNDIVISFKVNSYPDDLKELQRFVTKYAPNPKEVRVVTEIPYSSIVALPSYNLRWLIFCVKNLTAS